MPVGSDDVVMPNASGLIISDRALVTLRLALSVTRTVKLLDPAVPGVPNIVPPARINPEGSDPADSTQEYGGAPPEAESNCE